MDALSDVTATESEPLVDDSSNGLSDSSSRTAQSSTVAEIQLNDATSDNSLSYHAMSSVDKMNRKAEDSTTYSSDPKFQIMKTQLPMKERIYPLMKQRTCHPMT